MCITMCIINRQMNYLTGVYVRIIIKYFKCELLIGFVLMRPLCPIEIK
jgi:hypothetical protein